jgi:hypothetical protein
MSVPPGRGWRLGWLSWLILLATLAGLTFLVGAGAPRHTSQDELYDWAIADRSFQPYFVAPGGVDPMVLPVWSHGWPLEFCARVQQNPGFTQRPVMSFSWWSPGSWSLTSNVFLFNWWYLLLDILVAIAILVVAVVGFERWRRRRGRLRFSLFDAAVVATFACVALGWWRWHRHQQQVESNFLTSLLTKEAIGNSSSSPMAAFQMPTGATQIAAANPPTLFGVVHPTYHGPKWLARLPGATSLLPFCGHFDYVELTTSAMTEADCRDVAKLRYLERVDIHGRLTPELADALDSLSHLRELGAKLDRWEPLVRSSDAHLLGRLGQLEVLDLCSSDLAPGDLRILEELPNLKTLRISGGQFLVEDLQRLAEHPSLKLVFAEIAATEDEMRQFEESHPRLRVFWVDLPRLDGRADRRLRDPWYIAQMRIAHWRSEVRDYRIMGRREILSLTGVRLTRERLSRLPQRIFAEVNELRLGEFDSPETAAELFQRCGNVEYIQSFEAPLGETLIHELAKHPSLRQLRVLQGKATVDAFQRLVHLPTFKWLEIYGATFTPEEARAIHAAMRVKARDTFVDVFRGPVESPGSSILTGGG